MPDSNGIERVISAVTKTKRPDPEVVPKAKRRTFSSAYKLRILEEADACNKPGEIGALLRREGLYSSLLSDWRRQREAGSLAGLSPKKRGRKSTGDMRRIAELERENERLRRQLEQAETIIGVQKKLAGLLRKLPEIEDEEWS